MNDTKDDKKILRREFLKRAGLATGAIGAVAATLTPRSADAAMASDAGADGSGYHETEHVRKYYELARF